MEEGGERNLVLRFENQEGQKGWVRWRLVRKVYFVGWGGGWGVEVEVVVDCAGEGDGVIKAGTETRAEALLRIVRERVCHSIALVIEGNEEGRVIR